MVRTRQKILTYPIAPNTAATLTIRVIKSFPYRTSKNVILHNLDLTTLTVGELKEKVRNGASPSLPHLVYFIY
jgi:hypothetical protein